MDSYGDSTRVAALLVRASPESSEKHSSPGPIALQLALCCQVDQILGPKVNTSSNRQRTCRVLPRQNGDRIAAPSACLGAHPHSRPLLRAGSHAAVFMQWCGLQIVSLPRASFCTHLQPKKSRMLVLTKLKTVQGLFRSFLSISIRHRSEAYKLGRTC